MNSTEAAVLEVLKASLFDGKIDLLDHIDWREVYKELHAHAVTWLPTDILPEFSGLDEEAKKAWTMGAVRNMQRNYHILQEQDVLLKLLAAKGLKAVVIKGAAAAIHYPQPDYRCMGDVDLLLKEDEADKALVLMQEHGYRLSFPVDHSNRHYNLNKNGVEFEVHKSFSPVIDEILFEGMTDIQRGKLDDFEIPMLPELHNGLVFLVHAIVHLRVGIGLRHILDWVMYAYAVLDDAFWATSLQPVLKGLGLEEFAIVLTRMGQMYLGLPQENRTFCRCTDEAVCRELMAYVLDNGNFGVKNGKMGAAAGTLTEFGSVKELFVMLQKRGCITYENRIRKYPFLKPFAWLMRIGDLLLRGLRRGIGLDTMRSSFQESRKRVHLLDKLGVRGISEHKH